MLSLNNGDLSSKREEIDFLPISLLLLLRTKFAKTVNLNKVFSIKNVEIR